MNVLTFGILFLLLVTFVLAFGDFGIVNEEDHTVWTYSCQNHQCIKIIANGTEITTLENCNMLCDLPPLWPRPTRTEITEKASSTFGKNRIYLQINASAEVERDLKTAFSIFNETLPLSQPQPGLDDVDESDFQVNITVNSTERTLKLSTDESYSLNVQLSSNNSISAVISAQTYFGARHALETLSQLIWLDTHSKKLNIYHGVDINDRPAFAHRGLMVDTARNFISIKSLLRVVDGMAASKLNVLHLHLTDSVSFPIVLPNNPQFAEYGAYGPDKIYTPEDIKGLVEYARIRGIRTILEIDAPGHVNEGWNHDKDLGKLVICGEDNILNGQLNPDNENTLKVLKSIYEDLLELGTDPETFHVGGDEVNLDCYGQTEASKNFHDIYQFWANFSNQIFETVESSSGGNNPPKNIVIWSSPLTDYHLNQLKYNGNLVVQYWFGNLQSIKENGNKIIFSTVGQWYLDCGFGPWKPGQANGNCDPYKHWQTMYKYRPWQENGFNNDRVLGGEACLWTEQVDEVDVETRIWPRAAAFAERLWSDIPEFDSNDVFSRISIHRDRLIGRGFKVAAIWPLWCTKNPGKC